TFYIPGLGGCGKTTNGHDLIVAVGHGIFDSYPEPAPQESHLRKKSCGQLVRLFWQRTKSVVVTVEDRCTGCSGASDLDFTEAQFAKLASLNKGRI
ncbi:hypothetical protein B0H14DRAFT_2259420, partial [Mycena olivaceomarginata]